MTDNDGGADDDGQLMSCLLRPGLIYTLLTLTSANDPAYNQIDLQLLVIGS